MKRLNLIWCILLISSIICILSLSVVKINNAREKIINSIGYELPQQMEGVDYEETQEEQRLVDDSTTDVETTEYQEIETTTNENYSTEYETRMTSFWANDGYGTGECTGSGLCSWDFDINEHGWYTYQGKLVIATATEYLLKYGFTLNPSVRTYKYYNELVLNIDGIDYDAIVLDSCGSSMKNGRIDLFVSNGNSIKDTMIIVKEG